MDVASAGSEPWREPDASRHLLGLTSQHQGEAEPPRPVEKELPVAHAPGSSDLSGPRVTAGSGSALPGFVAQASGSSGPQPAHPQNGDLNVDFISRTRFEEGLIKQEPGRP